MSGTGRPERDAAAAMLERLPDLSEEIARTVWTDVPAYSAVLLNSDDLKAHVVGNLQVVFAALAEGVRVRDEDLESARRLGRTRALQGVPVESVVRSFRAAERGTTDVFLRYYSRLGGDFEGQCVGVQSIHDGFDRIESVTLEAYTATRLRLALPDETTGADLVGRLSSGEHIPDDDLARLAEALGMHVEQPHTAIAARPLTQEGMAALGPIRHHLSSRLLEVVQQPILTGKVRDTLVFLVPTLHRGPTAIAEAIGRALGVTQCRHEVTAAVGRPQRTLAAIGRSCREALESLDVAETLGPPRSVVTYDDVLLDVLLARNRDVAEDLVASALGPIVDQEHLLKTLAVYLANHQSTAATAAALVVHANTVTYRLRRISTLTGRDLHDSDHLLSLGLAMRARRALSNPG